MPLWQNEGSFHGKIKKITDRKSQWISDAAGDQWSPVSYTHLDVYKRQFLSQPFFVATQFTGMEGRYVPLSETIRGFQEILEGRHDDIPESYFLNAGSIDDVTARMKK